MTNKERIEQLEREVADLRMMVSLLQSKPHPRPKGPFSTPPGQLWPSPNTNPSITWFSVNADYQPGGIVNVW